MSAAMTIAAIVGATATAGSAAYGIYNGQQQAGEQKKALAQQKLAQEQAERQSLSTERKSAVAQNEASQQTPDVAAILKRAATMGNGGLSSTMLTGPAGVTNGMQLGKKTLLGS